MYKKWLISLFLLSAATAFAQPLTSETSLIDVPTARVLDKYQAALTTRAYANNTLMQNLDFGVWPQVNIGVSVAVYELLGNSGDIKVLTPDFQAKWKLFDGSLYFPAIAIGYDGRRYGYIRPTKQYLDNRKGGYVALSREIFVPGLETTLGANLSDFDRHDVYFFLGASFQVKEWSALLAEWDNINSIHDSRLNLGVRFHITEAFTLSGAVRRIGRGNENERIAQLRYTTHF